MQKTATVYDVAEHAGVSIATVSRVFRRPDDVRASTREHVLASVRALGYVPNASARGLAARRTGVLGLYFPDFDAVEDVDDADFTYSATVDVVVDLPDSGDVRRPNLYFDEVLRGSELQAWRDGFVLMVGVGRGSNPIEMVTDIAGRVDGLALLAHSVPDDVLEHVSRRIPIVLIAGARRGDDFDHVKVANAEGMHALARHVIDDLGVRDAVFVSGPSDTPDDRERYDGFRQALTESGIDPESLPVFHGDFSRERGRALANEILASGPPPRALMCSNDHGARNPRCPLVARGPGSRGHHRHRLRRHRRGAAVDAAADHGATAHGGPWPRGVSVGKARERDCRR
jgi:LacI family transcriptional regulator